MRVHYLAKGADVLDANVLAFQLGHCRNRLRRDHGDGQSVRVRANDRHFPARHRGVDHWLNARATDRHIASDHRLHDLHARVEVLDGDVQRLLLEKPHFLGDHHVDVGKAGFPGGQSDLERCENALLRCGGTGSHPYRGTSG
jgi:hypothetical protein